VKRCERVVLTSAPAPEDRRAKYEPWTGLYAVM
jgi:hypothetical protein